MELGDLIEALAAEDPAKVCPYGFAEPHSWRGDYADLAFSPARNVTVGSMLAHARSAVGSTYHGWKGGEYLMDVDSDCYLAAPRDLGETLGPTLLRLMLAAGSVPAAAPAEPTTEQARADERATVVHQAVALLQEMREDGETDLRQAIWRIEGLAQGGEQHATSDCTCWALDAEPEDHDTDCPRATEPADTPEADR
jgi:hypothetical protein